MQRAMRFRVSSVTIWVALMALSCDSDSTPGTDVPDGSSREPGAPVVTILSPTDGVTVDYGQNVRFTARVQSASEPVRDLEIRWSSSLNGVLDTTAADANGQLSFGIANLLPGEHDILLTASDSEGRSGVAFIGLTVRAASDAPVVTIQPAEPTSADALTAIVETVEPDSTLRVEWRQNGELTEVAGVTVSPELTARDDVWTVSVAVETAAGLGSPGAATVSIANGAPSCLSAVFVPATGTTTTAFECRCAERIEPDSGDDIVDRCELSVNGLPLEGSGCRVEASLTAKGDALGCAFIAGDGSVEGVAATAPEVIVESTPPTAEAATLTGDACGTLTCQVSGLADIDPADADSLSVVYRWEVNGSPVVATGAVLESSVVQPGDSVVCVAAPTDGTVLEGGELLTGAEVVSNSVVLSQPVASVNAATVLPAAPVVGDTLQCVPSGWTPTACGFEPRYGFRWYANGALVDGATRARLLIDGAVAGDLYRCEAIPLSGVSAGTGVFSAEVTVADVDPGAPVVQLVADAGADGEVTCEVRDLRDADLESAVYEWQINDDAPFDAAETLGPAKVLGCDRVRCTIRLDGGISSNTAELLLEQGNDCDGGECATGSCRPEGGCAFTAVTGACQGVDACAGAGTCVDGVCEATSVDCDDQNPCTADSCSPATGCVHTPLNDVACDDGNACTSGDTCVAGVCSGANTECRCSSDAECDDGNVCTAESCVDESCVYENLDGACDDGDTCTQGEQCISGECVGTEQPCSDLYLDVDGDGFGVGDPLCTCGPLNGYTASQAGDCDDNDPNVNPDADESPGDGVDSNCDEVELCYVDSDSDGYRTEASIPSTTGIACSGAGEITAAAEIDCNDDDPRVSPGATEIPGDGVDSDCNSRELCFVDADGDGFRSTVTEEISGTSCAAAGYASEDAAVDCDDANAAVNPDATELSDDGVDSNCDQIELFNGNALALDAPLSGETYDVGVSGAFQLGPFGTLNVTGSVQRDASGAVSWCVSTPVSGALGVVQFGTAQVQVCLDQTGAIITSALGDAEVSGYPVSLEGSFGLTAPFDYLFRLSGNLVFDGETYPVSGSSEVSRVGGVESWQIALAAGTVVLGPGATLESTEIIIDPSGVSIAALTRFGPSPNDVGLLATGEYLGEGDYSLSLSLAPGERWDPFGATLPLEVDSLSGTLTKSSDTVSVTVVGGVAGELDVVPGLTLTGATVNGALDSAGAWSVELAGVTSVDLGDGVRIVTIRGGVNSDGVFDLSGTLAGDPWEPLAPLIGDGRWIIEGDAENPFELGFVVDTGVGSFSAYVSSAMSICPLTECLDATVYAEGTIGNGFEGFFVGSLNGLTIPGFQTFDGVAFSAATANARDVDLFGDGSVIRDIPRGVTLAVAAPAPFELEGMVEEYLFIFSIQGLTGLRAEADFNLDLTIIPESANFPTIQYADLEGIYFFADIVPGVIDMGIGANVEFKPTNQAEVLLGNAEFAVSPAPLQMTGSMSILGRWLEPFALRKFAVQNPGFVLTLDFSAGGIPVPTSIGWNIDTFWLKSGEWPEQLPPDVPAPPPNVLTVGSSFFYDAIPSESGICFVGVCTPTPPFIIRKNLQNLTLNDVVSFTNDAVIAVTDPFSGFIPSAEIEPLDPSPVTIDVRTLQFVASTHNMDLFGQPFAAGVRFEFDAEVMGVNTFFLGALDPEGVLVIGRQDGFALPGAAFVGDPFWRELIPGNGYVAVPHDGALQPNTGLIEGWVRRGSWGGFMAAELARKTDASNGWTLGVGGETDGLGRVQLQIRNGGTTRTVESDPVVPRNADAHIAWQFDGAGIALYHDGARLTVSDTGPSIAAGGNTAPLEIGRRMGRVDDVRVWSALRSASEIGGQSRQLPTRFINPQAVVFPDSPLVARYEFDNDRSGSTAFNSRVYSSGSSLNGSYIGGASHQLRVNENPKELLIDLSPPPPLGRPPGFGVKAGFDVSIPGIPNGDFTMGVFGKLGDGSALLRFQAREFLLLPLGLPPNDLGAFWVGGLGPNLINDQGGKDDGPYGEVDFNELYFAGTSRFEFRPQSGSTERFATGTFVLDEQSDYMFVDGRIDLLLPIADDSFGVTGQASFDTRDPFPRMMVAGDVVVFGESFAGVDVEISQQQASFRAGWQLPEPPFLPIGESLAGLSTQYTINFVDESFCALTEANVLGETCSVGICFFARDVPDFIGECFGVGLPCLENSQCRSNTCNFGVCIDPNTVPSGLPCTTSNACVSDQCIAGVCVAVCGDGICEPPGEVCGAGTTLLDCNPDCGTCGNGNPCDSNADCNSGACNFGICTPSDLPNGTPCSTNAACASNACNLGFCVPANSVPSTVPCSTDNACVSGDCTGGVCIARCGDGACEPPQEVCGGGNSGFECRNDCGRCPNGAPCLSNSTCSSNACNFGICAPNNNPNGTPCSTSNACASNRCRAGLCTSCGDGSCNGGEVCSPVTTDDISGLLCYSDCGLCTAAPCTSNSQCASNSCSCIDPYNTVCFCD